MEAPHERADDFLIQHDWQRFGVEEGQSGGEAGANKNTGKNNEFEQKEK